MMEEEKSGSLELSLTQALSDSPLFRANMQYCEDQFDSLFKWTEISVKMQQNQAAEWQKDCKRTLEIAKTFNESSSIELLDDQKTIPALKTLAEMIESLNSYRLTSVDKLESLLLNPLQEFLGNDLKPVKDSKKLYDKAMEKYENALSKYHSLLRNNNKDGTLGKDEYTSVSDARKSYFKVSVEHCHQICKHKLTLNEKILTKYLNYVSCLLEYHESSSLILKSFKPMVDSLKAKLEEESTDLTRKVAELDSIFEDINKKGFVGGTSNLSQANSSSAKSWEKSGYLFERKQPKGLNPVSWLRTYCVLCDGVFTVYNFSRQRGMYVKSDSLQVLICELKPNESTERKYVFSIISIKKSFVFQAESEDEYKEWIKVFEMAKMYSLQPKPSLAGDEKVSTKSSETLIKEQSKRATEDAVNETESMISEIAYNDDSVMNANSELHERLPSLSESEYVLAYGTFLKDFVIQGKLYVTQVNLHFYSDSFGAINHSLISLKDIVSLEKVERSIYTDIVIKTDCAEFTFKTIIHNDAKIFDAIRIAKDNVQKQEHSLQGLHEEILKNMGIEFPESKDNLGAVDQTQTSEEDKVICNCCEHGEQKEFEVVLNVQPSKVFEALFGENLEFLVMMGKKRENYDVSFDKTWSESGEREFRYKSPLKINNPLVKVKFADCTEKFKIQQKEENRLYVVYSTAKTPNVPFGDSFENIYQYCISKWGNSTRLVVHSGVNFLKYNLFKGQIKSEGNKQNGSNFQSFLAELPVFLGSEAAKLEAAIPEKPKDVAGWWLEPYGWKKYFPSSSLNFSILILVWTAFFIFMGSLIPRSESNTAYDRSAFIRISKPPRAHTSRAVELFDKSQKMKQNLITLGQRIEKFEEIYSLLDEIRSQ